MELRNGRPRTLDELGPHDHACLIYQWVEEKLAALVPYFQAGLGRNEKCLYVGPVKSADVLWNALEKAGAPVSRAVDKGQLANLAAEEVYLEGGRFVPELTVALYRNFVEEGRGQGYAAVRAAAEMDWVLGGKVDMADLTDYESVVNRLFHDSEFGAICAYDYSRFSPEVLTKIVHTHPLVIFGGKDHWNPFFIPPDEYLRPHDPSVELARMLSVLSKARRQEG
ncbi:MAG: MEDS domain-containing protein [Elusimicrobia bacterium]|nr:MEDS domain-containing protein [Elusimicrobiota bacterium]